MKVEYRKWDYSAKIYRIEKVEKIAKKKFLAYNLYRYGDILEIASKTVSVPVRGTESTCIDSMNQERFGRLYHGQPFYLWNRRFKKTSESEAIDNKGQTWQFSANCYVFISI